MKAFVSGGTGLVGRYVVEGLLDQGYAVRVGGRTKPQEDFFSRPVEFSTLTLDPDIDQIDLFDDAYVFIHCAFDHRPGLYRGGEGDDPRRFFRRNLDGTARLFDTARRAGIRRAIFLSSRAVYDGIAAGTTLTEDLDLKPDTVYGQVKLDAERTIHALADHAFAVSSLRLTGVYGPLGPAKWDAMIAGYLAGNETPVRAGSEVHGCDVAQAIDIILSAEAGKIQAQAFNVSDVLTDTREILSALAADTRQLPAAADRSAINVMSTAKLRARGWQPGGAVRIAETVQAIASRLRALA